jgi:hypothetical protein
MQSLLLTFAYLIPMNFLGQFYSGSFYAERVRRRGVLLLSTPMTSGQILLGKSLPYLAVTLLFAVVVTLVIGAGWLGFLASLPIVGFVLASSLLLALVAPHPRALTFLLVAITTLFSTFLFLPAVFVEIHPVAFISPVSVIATSIRQELMTTGEFLYATVPLTLITLALAAVSVPLYREESLFSPRGMLSRVVDAVGIQFRSRWRLVGAGVLTVPFAMGLELFVLVFAIALDLRVAFLFFLFGAAFVEEALKALPAYGHLGRPGAQHPPWLVGLLIGTGFFVGEKLALLLGLVGFGLLDVGPDVLATFGIAGDVTLVVAPLALHVGTVTITAYMCRRGRGGVLLGWWIAGLVHVAYNATIILGLGGFF